jgi:hypothetical protein
VPSQQPKGQLQTQDSLDKGKYIIDKYWWKKIKITTKTTIEVPKIAGRNTKANIFQKGRVGFKATIDLNKKKKCIKMMSPLT